MEGETVFRIVVERAEERDALDVVPVKVRNENVGANGFAFGFALELLSEAAQSGAAIEDVEVFARENFDAGGVATVTQIVGLGSRRGSAYAPELDTHTSPLNDLS